MSDKQKIYAKGMYYDLPREGAPNFVLGRISFKVTDAIAFLQENVNEKGYVNCDIKKGKDKPYVELNTWKKEENKSESSVENSIQEIDGDQIPF